MPFDAAGFNWRDYPEPDRSRWELLNNALHRFALLLARGALVGIVLIYVACAVAIVTGNRPECVIADPFQACR